MVEQKVSASQFERYNLISFSCNKSIFFNTFTHLVNFGDLRYFILQRKRVNHLVLPDIREVSCSLHQWEGQQDGRRQEEADRHPVLLVNFVLDDACLLDLLVVLSLLRPWLDAFSRIFWAAESSLDESEMFLAVSLIIWYFWKIWPTTRRYRLGYWGLPIWILLLIGSFCV